jgi:hypothetical protein
MNLPEDTPNAFRLFLTWIYKGNLGTPVEIRDPESVLPLLELFILADKIGCLPLKKRTYEYLRENITITCIDPWIIKCVYSGTQTFSPLRAVLCKRIAAWVATRTKRDNYVYSWCLPLFQDWPEFAADLMQFGSPLVPSLNYKKACRYQAEESWVITE